MLWSRKTPRKIVSHCKRSARTVCFRTQNLTDIFANSIWDLRLHKSSQYLVKRREMTLNSVDECWLSVFVDHTCFSCVVKHLVSPWNISFRYSRHYFMNNKALYEVHSVISAWCATRYNYHSFHNLYTKQQYKKFRRSCFVWSHAHSGGASLAHTVHSACLFLPRFFGLSKTAAAFSTVWCTAHNTGSFPQTEVFTRWRGLPESHSSRGYIVRRCEVISRKLHDFIAPPDARMRSKKRWNSRWSLQGSHSDCDARDDVCHVRTRASSAILRRARAIAEVRPWRGGLLCVQIAFHCSVSSFLSSHEDHTAGSFHRATLVFWRCSVTGHRTKRWVNAYLYVAVVNLSNVHVEQRSISPETLFAERQALQQQRTHIHCHVVFVHAWWNDSLTIWWHAP